MGDVMALDADNVLPRIDAERCTGCSRCVDGCPTHALSQMNAKAVLSAPELCILCDLCEEICPEYAIALPFFVLFAPAQSAQRGSKPA